MVSERGVSFEVGQLFYRPSSRVIRDLGVLSLAVLASQRVHDGRARTLRVLDSMSGTGVRALRYSSEVANVFVHANDLQVNYPGAHPLRENLAAACEANVATVTGQSAVDLYLRSKLDDSRFDLVDCDAFGTGQPHTGDAWRAVKRGGLLYLCASDSMTTAGLNPGKAATGFAAVAARHMPACNEQAVRLLMGSAFREAAARGLHAEPIFGYFHAQSSTIRAMLRLRATKAPTPTVVERKLQYVARCRECGELWRVPVAELARAEELRLCEHHGKRFTLSGPLWVAPMHDAGFVCAMLREAEARSWSEAEQLLRTMAQEAEAERHGAMLFLHDGELQRALALEQLQQPPLETMIEMLRADGHGASRSHMRAKALKTSASLGELVRVVSGQCSDESRAPNAASGDTTCSSS
mmetsp:Transcript_8585/g.20096  ORF Transcript_8585/g.20096 Transcript_8585/m.20096 type:complete len:410 (-) Transcript_8585:169-1398(-)